MTTTLIKEREERTKRRKKDKARYDKEFALAVVNTDKKTLSVNKSVTGSRIRLLDEGSVVGDGKMDFYIKKGTLSKFLKGENEFLGNLPDDYVGNVNLGHLDFATFPFIIGEFTKGDLHLVDIGRERQGLDVDLRVDEESIFVQELARQPYDIAISSEFYYNADTQATEDMGVLVIDEVLITAYALVGEPGNVNSDGLKLKGDRTVEKVKIIVNDEKLAVDEETQETAPDVKEAFDEPVETPAEEDESKEAEEDKGEETEGEEANSEEAEGEEAEDEEGGLDKIEEAFTKLQEENKELSSKIEALEEKLSRVQKKLKAKNDEIDEFTNKFKGLSISTGLVKEEKTEDKKEEALYKGENGIGEL